MDWIQLIQCKVRWRIREYCNDPSRSDQTNDHEHLRTRYRVLCLLIGLYKLLARAACDSGRNEGTTHHPSHARPSTSDAQTARFEHITQPRITRTIREDDSFFLITMVLPTACWRTCAVSRLHQPSRLARRCWRSTITGTVPYIKRVLGLPVLSMDSWPLKMGQIGCTETSGRITNTCCVIAQKNAVLEDVLICIQTGWLGSWLNQRIYGPKCLCGLFCEPLDT